MCSLKLQGRTDLSEAKVLHEEKPRFCSGIELAIVCTGEGCLRTGSIIQELRLVINRGGRTGFSIAYYWIYIFSICFSPSPFSSHSQIVSLCSLGWLLILYTDKARLKLSGILLHIFYYLKNN